MPDRGHCPAQLCAPFDDDRAEAIVVEAYLQLPRGIAFDFLDMK